MARSGPPRPRCSARADSIPWVAWTRSPRSARDAHLVRAQAFDSPTPAQALGWPAIASGEHTLIQAPTGSGKTLAAFLYGIDRLTEEGAGRGLRLLYVSPLKALNYDIERNLRGPLAGLAPICVAVRTGDTPQRERAQMLRDTRTS